MIRRSWREDEIEVIRINGQSTSALAAQLGRSIGSVEMKKKRLSTKPPRRFWTEDEIALALSTGVVPGRTTIAVDDKLRTLRRG